MSHIDLLRHGEVQGGSRFCGHHDVPLTPTGWQQMYSRVAQQQWDVIVTSPLVRCADFAQVWGWQQSLAVIYEPRLQEMHFGVWEGKTAAEIMIEDENALSNFWTDPEQYSPPQGESLVCFSQRVLAAWHDVLQRYQDQRVLVVTHGGVIRLLAALTRQWPAKRLLEVEVKHASLWRYGSEAVLSPLPC